MKNLKSEVGKPVFFVILVIAVLAICWFGWNSMKGPYEKWDEKAVVDAAQKKMAANGIDIRTVPTWSQKYYLYHPEDKRPRPPVQMPTIPGMGAVPGSTPGVATMPGASGTSRAGGPSPQ